MAVDFKYQYRQVSNSQDAYDKVCLGLTPEYMSSFEVPATKSCNDKTKMVTISGSGFCVDFNFDESEVIVTMKLSFLLKPLKSKIVKGLTVEFEKVL